MSISGNNVMSGSASPVFIIGGSRTGSEMLKTMLSASPEIDFVDELFLQCPSWLHRDLQTNIREHVGDLQAPEALDKLIELLYSGIPYGWFWSVVESQIDRNLLRQALTGSDLSLQTVFTALMDVHATMRGKSGRGAKFPMHYSSTLLLLEWFPNCKLIHTTRNPKAVLASQSNKYLRDDQGRISRAIVKLQHFVHINLQVSWTARLHRQLEHLSNYRLIRYEDIVCEPEQQLRKLCRFLDVAFSPDMLSPKQYGSSFDSIGGDEGIDRSSLERWRTTLSPLTGSAMDALHRSANRTLGYGGQSNDV